MHFSAILVLSPPEHFSRCLEALAVLPGVEIHHTDQESGRAIVVQESETLQGQEESLRRIQCLPAVTREIPAGARHNCTICHVLQTGAPPLVKNRFADGRTNTTQ